MSATLPNLNLLAEWLSADLYQTEFRPVPLSEHIKIGNKLFDSKFQFVRDLNPEVKINVRKSFKKILY
jgi:DNA polymerase theta